MEKVKFIIKALIIFLIIISAAQNIQGQIETNGQSLIVSNSVDTINPNVRIKWFIPEISNPQGINIYRRAPGQQNWQKIVDKPFKKGDFSIPNEEFYKDTTLGNYVNFIDGLTDDELQGLTLAMILIKGIQNSSYAKYIGIEYHDTNVELGNKYQYKVTKITPSGEKEIGISQIITVQKHQPIEPPEEIQIKPGDEQVLIKWKPDKSRFYGVNIFRRKESQTEFEKMNPVPIIMSKRKGKDGVVRYPEIFFTDDSLSNGVTYFYKIVGLDYFGRDSKHSKIYKVVPKDQTAPLSPQFLRCKVDLLNVKLNWENRYSPDIAGINIYRSLHHDVGFRRVNENIVDYNVNEYVDIVEKPGKYYYYVAAVDSSGNEGKSFLTLANVLDIYPPEKPKGLYAEADTGRIVLHWFPNTDSDLLGYQVYRTVDKDSRDRYVLLNATPFIDTMYIDSLPISAKNKFHYRIAAMDSAYNRSEYSEFAAKSMPDIVPPAQPFIKDVIITENNYLQVRWIKNADLDLKGYNIFKEITNDSLGNKEKLNENVISSVVNHFTDRWVESGIKYNYYLEAVDTSGNKSEYSNPFPGVLPKVKAELRSDIFKFLNVKNKGEYNLVRWEIKPEEGFLGAIVYRKSENGVYRPLTGLMQDNKFKDKEINSGYLYYYEVRAYYKKYGECKSNEEKVVVPEEEYD